MILLFFIIFSVLSYDVSCDSGYSKNADCLRCSGDRNTTLTKCPNPCPRTCQFPGGSGPCDKSCIQEGCECSEGYYLNEEGNCVQLQDCPGARVCTVNETFAFCNVGCPNNYCPEDDSLGIIACSPPFPCESGCSCKRDYLRLGREDDRCILGFECPPVSCNRPNEIWNGCPPPCLNERCSDIGVPSQCDLRFFSCRPRCVCKPGFFRNDNDICIPWKFCPPKCGYNEMPVQCKTVCPPQSCDISYTEYACGDTICEPGCDCLPNFLRNASGICIPNEECPPPPVIPSCRLDQNEELSSCKIICPPQSCESIFISYLCLANIPCEYGCNCIQGYLRNSNGVCIPSEQCPKNPPLICGHNEKPSDCKVTCPPQSCESIFTTYFCEGKDICEPGCDCLDGYLRNSDGICIPSEECFLDPPIICGLNEKSSDCKVTCPPQTCESIFTTYFCKGKDICEPGCDCLNGYLRNSDGICIPSEECFLDPPIICGLNEKPSHCKVTCPPQSCDSIFTTYICEGKDICEPGCDCLDGYLRNSDGICIPSEECFMDPPIICGLNEKPSDCKVTCPPQTCESIFTTYFCEGHDICEPGCDCLDGYLRNDSGICVPSDECFLAPCKVQSDCRPTCAEPNPPGCPYITPSESNEDGCNCQPGYILSEPDGKCIKIDECPLDIGCNGDLHARIKECPLACPSTCEAPNAFPCRKKCDPVGCECEPGYIFSDFDGFCILPDQCIGGNPCGPNATFVTCKYNCPSFYCPTDDSRAVVICETFPFSPCLSGCVCKLNHRILSRENPICIRSDECPKVDCTRANEEWNPCPVECFSEYCEDVDNINVTCNTLVLNCNPRCSCKKSYFRDPKTDICVTSNECRQINMENQPQSH